MRTHLAEKVGGANLRDIKSGGTHVPRVIYAPACATLQWKTCRGQYVSHPLTVCLFFSPCAPHDLVSPSC